MVGGTHMVDLNKTSISIKKGEGDLNPDLEMQSALKQARAIMDAEMERLQAGQKMLHLAS